MIPCEIDRKSGSSSAARGRRLNSEASRRFRQRQRDGGILLRVGVLSVRVLNAQEDQDAYVVYPPDHILVQCQDLFGSGRSEFTPEEVFIVIQKMSTPNADFPEELHFLQRIMQTRLSSSGVFDTDEGRFIRLAIAFSRSVSLSGVPHLHPNVLERGGSLVDLKDVIPGIWEIQVRLPSSECVVPVRGNLAELMERIHYDEPAFLPPAPTRLDLNYGI